MGWVKNVFVRDQTYASDYISTIDPTNITGLGFISSSVVIQNLAERDNVRKSIIKYS